MARTQNQVQADLFAIQPDGWALPADMDSAWGPMISPIAAEVALFERQADALAGQINPGAATALLPDYERVLGPDPCGRDQAGLSFGGRQALAFQRWTTRGGSSPAFFIGLAASVGVAITITENAAFHWVVNLPMSTVIYFVSGVSQAGNALGMIVPSLVECVIRLFAPAHKVVTFNYSGTV